MIGDKQIVALSFGALLLVGTTLYPSWRSAKAQSHVSARRKTPANQISGLVPETNSLWPTADYGGHPRASAAAAEQQRLIRALEQAINTGDPAMAEGSFWKYLPALLADGGEGLIETLIAGTPRGPMRTSLLRVSAVAWAKRDSAAALAWTTRLPDQRERDEAYNHVLFSLAESEPARAVRLAAGQTEAEEAERTARVERLVQSWAKLDFLDAKEWVLVQPAGEPRDQWVARIAAVQAVDFPRDAARFALEQIAPGPIQEETVLSIVGSWAERDPLAAQQWVRSFPTRSLRARAMNEVQGVATARTTEQPAAEDEPSPPTGPPD